MSVETTSRNILVEINDPTAEEQPALSRASTLLALTGGRVTLFSSLFHTQMNRATIEMDSLLAKAKTLLIQQWEQDLAALKSRLPDDVTVEVEVCWARDSWSQFIDCRRAKQSDLIVLDDQSEFRRHTQEILRHSPVPVLIVKSDGQTPYRNVTAAIDPLHADDKPAELDQHILTTAKQVTQAWEANLTILNIVTPVSTATGMTGLPVVDAGEVATESMIEAHKAKVASLLEAQQISPSAISVVPGSPANTLIEHTHTEDCDLLILGAIARSAIKRLLIGHTAESILAEAKCDMLVVKPPQWSGD